MQNIKIQLLNNYNGHLILNVNSTTSQLQPGPKRHTATQWEKKEIVLIIGIVISQSLKHSRDHTTNKTKEQKRNDFLNEGFKTSTNESSCDVIYFSPQPQTKPQQY